MKTLKSFILAASCFCAVQPVGADTIVLKNGEKLDGRVLREEGDDYVLEIRVSNTIRDEKRIPKSEVSFIDKEMADLKDFEAVEKLVPTPELLDTVAYEERVKKIEEFLATHPKSGKAARAKEMLVVLDEELAVVREGGIKFGEEMVSADDYKANAYEYDSVIAGKRIRETVARRDLLSALRLFSEYDKTFRDAEGRGEVVDLVRQVLAAYASSLDESIAGYDSRMERRETGLKQMSLEDRTQTQRALEDEQARLAAKFAAEKETKEAWVTPNEFHKESLEEAKRQVDSEVKRLDGVSNDKPLDIPLAESYRVAWGKMTGGNDEEKKALLGKLKSERMPEKYLAMLAERAGLPTE